MRRFAYFLWISCFLTLISFGHSQAQTWDIDDTYIGGTYYSGYDSPDGDVIGNADIYDIDGMQVTIQDDGQVQVIIKTDYDPDGTVTDYGDLFISTNGWTPDDSQTGYTTDTYYTGEEWEFALNTESGYIYSVDYSVDDTLGDTPDNSNILLSNDLFGSYSRNTYRNDQEVQINTGVSSSLGLTFDFDDSSDSLLIYSFDLSSLGLSGTEELNLGFHWAMTCANDTIEGSIHKAAVPEPGTMILLSAGLLGMGALGRKKRRRG